MNTFEVIAARRSAKVLTEPAPDDHQLRQMLTAAVQAPDHKELKPWQFIVLRGDKKDRLAEVMVEGLKSRDPEVTDGQIEKERSKPGRAPLIVVVVARRMPSALRSKSCMRPRALRPRTFCWPPPSWVSAPFGEPERRFSMRRYATF